MAAPNAPTNLRFRDRGYIKYFELSLDYDRGTPNGTPLSVDQVEWALDKDFEQVIWLDGATEDLAPAGYSNPRGLGDGPGPMLLPGTVYWVRARSGASGQGYGPWSQAISGRTLAPARVRLEGKWEYAIPYVMHEGIWKLAEVWHKKDNAYRRVTQ